MLPMPVLELGDISAPGGSYRAQIAVRSVMAWPKDEVARKQYLATIMARHLGELQRSAQELPDPARAEDWFETVAAIDKWEAWQHAEATVSRWFDEGGGFTAVADAPRLTDYQDQMTGQASAWFAAGLILALIRRMATHHTDLPGGASVNKAVFILERVHAPMVPRNSHDLRRAWATYKPVAHFCAALFDFFMDATEVGDAASAISAEIERKLREEFPAFLALADAYQQFGVAYAPPRAKGQPILGPTEAWLLPDEKQWPPTPYVPAPFDTRLLDAARAYRAPIPGI
jgi:hypothetical protein